MCNSVTKPHPITPALTFAIAMLLILRDYHGATLLRESTLARNGWHLSGDPLLIGKQAALCARSATCSPMERS